MAKAQKDRFSNEQQELATIAKALSHPARIAILEHIALRNMCICGDLVDVVPLSQSTVSQHLKVLREAGLITGEIEGPKSCYCVDWTKITAARAAIIKWFSKAEEMNACC